MLLMLAVFSVVVGRLQSEVLPTLLQITKWTHVLGINMPLGLRHMWSLAAEQQFYLIWPFVLVGLVSRFSRTTAAVLIVAVLLALCAWRT